MLRLIASLLFLLMCSPALSQQGSAAATPSANDLATKFEKLRTEASRYDPTCMAKLSPQKWAGEPSRCLCRAICARGTGGILAGDEKLWFSTCADALFCVDVAPPTASVPHDPEFYPPEERWKLYLKGKQT